MSNMHDIFGICMHEDIINTWRVQKYHLLKMSFVIHRIYILAKLVYISISIQLYHKILLVTKITLV